MTEYAQPGAPLVGILGGMGPAATADFYSKLIAATPATADQQHLRVMIWADPTVPDRSAALTGAGEDPTPKLIAGAQKLAEAGASFYVATCNGAHAFLPRVREAVDLDYLSIVDTTVEYLAGMSGVRRAGILATDATLTARLYDDALERRGIEPIVPDVECQRVVMESVFAIKAGGLTPHQHGALINVTARLVERGADVLVAACTEIPLAITGDQVSKPLIDPAALLADAAVAKAVGMTGPTTI